MKPCPHTRHIFKETDETQTTCDGVAYVELGDMTNCEYFAMVEDIEMSHETDSK